MKENETFLILMKSDLPVKKLLFSLLKNNLLLLFFFFLIFLWSFSMCNSACMYSVGKCEENGKADKFI